MPAFIPGCVFVAIGGFMLFPGLIMAAIAFVPLPDDGFMPFPWLSMAAVGFVPLLIMPEDGSMPPLPILASGFMTGIPPLLVMRPGGLGDPPPNGGIVDDDGSSMSYERKRGLLLL